MLPYTDKESSIKMLSTKQFFQGCLMVSRNAMLVGTAVAAALLTVGRKFGGGKAIGTMTETEFRKKVVAIAESVNDWSAGDDLTHDRFEDILGEPPKGSKWDLDRPFRIFSDEQGKLVRTEGISTCGLGARGISFAAGVKWPEYARPYDYLNENVFRVMQNHAMKFGAFRLGLPKIGDHFIIGKGYQTHMGTCVALDGSYVASVDAGQTDPTPSPGRQSSLQCFKRIVRDWNKQTVVCVLDTWLIYQGFFSAK
jgi:hypothetical protein